MDFMKKEESYAERRQLFKNIWETAMQIDEKDDLMSKPKVIKKHSCSKFPPESLFLNLLWINPAVGKSLSEGTAGFTDKTLRLDEVDRCVIGRRKKERIRNLRTVCNKILDFCDRQDADDMYYQQLAEGAENTNNKINIKSKKQKMHRGKKRIKKAKSLSVDDAGDQAKATTSDGKDHYPDYIKQSANPSPVKTKRVGVRRTVAKYKTSKVKSNPENLEASNEPGKISVTRRKLDRKKRNKRKKPSDSNASPTSGASNKVRIATPITGRTIVRRIKKLLTVNKVVIV